MTASCLLLALGVMAGLYDIPLQAFLQDRSPPESRGSIMAAYNFLTFAGMLAGLGRLLAAVRPAGSFRPNDLPRRRPRHRPGHDLHRPPAAVSDHAAGRANADRLHVSRSRGRAGERAGRRRRLVVANHVSWADGVLLGLACPRHPRMIAYAKYFENRWLGWFGRLGRIIPIGTTPQVDGRIDPRRPARLCNRAKWCASFPKADITRTGEIAGVPPRFPVDTEGYRTPRSCRSTWEGSGEASSATRAESSSGNGPDAGAVPDHHPLRTSRFATQPAQRRRGPPWRSRNCRLNASVA